MWHELAPMGQLRLPSSLDSLIASQAKSKLKSLILLENPFPTDEQRPEMARRSMLNAARKQIGNDGE